MATNTPIEWTEATWNPLTGCTKVSPGCKNCYAERMSKRLKAMGQANYANGFQLTLHRHALQLPLSWKKPQRIFVNSMSDLFHKDVPDDFIHEVFDVMARAHWHQFQVLTKRAERVEELSAGLPWRPHIWQGVSVENADYTFRVDHLRRTGAAVKFLSVEPLLGPIDELDLSGIDWVIVGGESGPGSRPMRYEWVKRLREICEDAGVAMFFKQTGEKLAREKGYQSRKGCDDSEWPKSWRVRQFPSLPVIS
jgi:protein gp37